jgi:hypothetical protein
MEAVTTADAWDMVIFAFCLTTTTALVVAAVGIVAAAIGIAVTWWRELK